MFASVCSYYATCFSLGRALKSAGCQQRENVGQWPALALQHVLVWVGLEVCCCWKRRMWASGLLLLCSMFLFGSGFGVCWLPTEGDCWPVFAISCSMFWMGMSRTLLAVSGRSVGHCLLLPCSMFLCGPGLEVCWLPAEA